MSRMDCNKVKTHPWQRGTGFFFCRDSNRTVLVNIRSAGLPLLFIKCIDRKCVGISSSNEESINALPSLSSAVHLLFYRRRRRRRRSSPFLNHCRHMVRPSVSHSNSGRVADHSSAFLFSEGEREMAPKLRSSTKHHLCNW